jgi:hypothetical protein
VPVGLVATSYCRSLGVPCLQYIDDRWIGKKSFSKQSGIDRKKDAQRCLYVVSEVLIRLDYFINIEKY